MSFTLAQVGPKVVLTWFGHYLALVAFTVLSVILGPLVAIMPRGIRQGFMVRAITRRRSA